MKYEEQKEIEGNFQTSGFDSNVNDKLINTENLWRPG